MEQFVIDARKRDKQGTGAARAYRREGLIPGVVYGQGQDALPIVVDARQFGALLRHHGSLINLKIDGELADSTLAALVKDTQRDPVSRQVLSVDLQWVSLTEAVEVQVPLVLIGEAPGVTRDGGSLEQVMHEITVSCLPGEIPENIAVDISGMEIGNTLHVRDLLAPEGITLVSSEDDVMVTIARPIRAEDLEVQVAEEGEEVAVVGAEGAEEAAPEAEAAEGDKSAEEAKE
ncbi:MAG: 50S ribosomal protein L25 [Armatimonadetes bacterium]|nr:50S ribosomal protein L25 [Armatimonadota bacterium]